MGEEFEISRVVDLPAAADQAFDAVTSRTAAWLFPTPPVEQSVGAVGPMGRTVAWEPGRRVAIRTDGENGWYNALDYTLEQIDAQQCRLTYTHTGVFLDGWDTQYDAASQHTDFYLSTLRSYLRHFPGRDAAYVGAATTGLQAPPSSARPGSFGRVRAALCATKRMRPGQPLSVDVAGTSGLHGSIDYLTERFIGVRTEHALFRFFGRDAWGMPVAMAGHVFTDIDHERVTAAWQSWLDLLYL